MLPMHCLYLGVLFFIAGLNGLNEKACVLLTGICEKDPSCIDHTVFYKRCIKKDFILSDTESTSEKQEYDNRKVKHVYGLYQRESVREDIRALKSALLDAFKEHIEKEKLISDNHIPVDSASVAEKSDSFTEDNIKPSRLAIALDGLKSITPDGKTHIVRDAVNTINNYLLEHAKTRAAARSDLKYSQSYRTDALDTAFSRISSYLKEKLAADPHLSEVDSAKLLLVLKSVTVGEDNQTSDKEFATSGNENNVHDKLKSSQEANSKPELNIASAGHKESSKKHVKDREENAQIVEEVEPSKRETNAEEESRNGKYLTLKFGNNVSSSGATSVGHLLQKELWNIKPSANNVFDVISVQGQDVIYEMNDHPLLPSTAKNTFLVAGKINSNADLTEKITSAIGAKLLSVSAEEDKPSFSAPLQATEAKASNESWDHFALITAVIGGCTLGLIVASVIVCAVRRGKRKSMPIDVYKAESVKDLQDLCRSHMSVTGQVAKGEEDLDDDMKHSWNEDPFPYNMDITTGHAVLSYMEDHVKNEDRLNKEWEALCSYKSDNQEVSFGTDTKNTPKNRYRDMLPFDKTRVKLREAANIFHSDYINANFVMDVDPRNPDYIATQGPLDNTVSDFWQMIWEQGVVVIVNLTKLSDMGLQQCHRYWPEDGCQVYHVFEVHLISEHIWCDDYLVRSLYIKNLQTGETRTVTQFHYLTWPDLSVPTESKPLLEFRRKINKCYRGHACPIVIHCNNGVGRTGTYILIDMVLTKMIKGAKEMDIAATLEHIRDQRADMVKTKDQFEFALTAVAEEVTAILSSLRNK